MTARTGVPTDRVVEPVRWPALRALEARADPIMELIILPLLFVAMWFVLIRPQQARLRAQRDLVASLQAGDRVVTAGGILGTITVLGESELRLEVSPGVELEVLRGAVSRRITPAGGAGGGDERDDRPEEPG